MEDDVGIGGKRTCLQPIAIKNIKLLNHCVMLFSFRKGKTENFSYQFRAKSSFVINLLNKRNRKNSIYFYC